MNLEFDVRDTEISAFLRAVYRDQLPFATSTAINLTARDFQKAQREHQEDIFTIRRKAFVQNAVKIKPFAKKTSLEARVLIDPPGGQARADILTKFEDQSQKIPFSGTHVAIPTEHVPRKSGGVVRNDWRPKAVLKRRFAEPYRAFVRKKGTKQAIYFDEGDRIVPLYWLVPRVRIRPELNFVANAQRTVTQRFNDNFATAFDRAMNTARGSGVSVSGLGSAFSRIAG